jgi:type I restriction enzyme S subunit
MNSVKLKDIGFSQTGPFGSQLHEEDYVDVGTPIVTVEHLGETGFTKQNLPLVSDLDKERLKKYTLIEGDIVFSRVGSVDRSTYVSVNEEGWLFSGRCIRVRIDQSKANPKFISFYFRQKRFKEMMKNISVGATMPSLNTSLMDNIPLNIPNLEIQSQIAKVLSDLDAKIELNNKINTELEAMAKLIYDYWFVQFDFPNEEGKPYKSSGGKMVWNEELKREIPEGWEVESLGKIGNFKNGVNYDPSNPGEIACPIINVRNISSSRFFLKNEDLDIIYLRESDVRKYSVHKGSIIIARSGIPGATRLISDMAENTLYCGFAIHFELENLNLKIPVFFYLKSIEQQIQSGSGGTILKNVNQATLNDLKISLPKENTIIDHFNNQIEPLFNKINLIQIENQKLSELRDWLLPMLMNGQVKVK